MIDLNEPGGLPIGQVCQREILLGQYHPSRPGQPAGSYG